MLGCGYMHWAKEMKAHNRPWRFVKNKSLNVVENNNISIAGGPAEPSEDSLETRLNCNMPVAGGPEENAEDSQETRLNCNRSVAGGPEEHAEDSQEDCGRRHQPLC